MSERKAYGTRAERERKIRALRRALVLPSVVVAVCLLPLALIRRCETRIDADLTVNEFAFDLGESSLVLIAPTSFDEIYAFHGVNAQIRDGGGRIIRSLSRSEGSLTIRNPRLNALQVRPNAHVALRLTSPSSIGVSITRSVASAEIGAPAGIDCDYCEVDGRIYEQFHWDLGPEARVRLTGVGSELHLVFSTSTESIIADHIAIRNPSFLGGSEAPQSSVVADSTLTLTEIPLPVIPVRTGDVLSFDQPRDFTIDRIVATPEGFRITMKGWVSGVTTTADGSNRLPTLLQRLHASQSLMLYGGLVILVAGTFISAVRELRLVEPPK